MMTSMITNPVTNTNSDRSRRKKKKKSAWLKDNNNQQQSHVRWKSETQEKIYSSKLVQALSQVSLNNNNNNDNTPSTLTPRRGQAVREAADRALAFAAKGRTRWSRAILTSRRVKLKFRKQRRRSAAATVAAAFTGRNRSRKPRVSVLKLKAKSLPAVQRKVKILGRLVPGCRKEPLPVILEEVTDYISALEMQVRAMTALADLLSGSGSGSGAASSSSAPPPQSPPPTSQ